MNKSLQVLTLIGCIIFSITMLVIGCGQQADTQTTTTTTTLPSGGKTVISGRIFSGTVRSAGVKVAATGVKVMGSATTPIANYSVVAVGTVDNKVYFSGSKTAGDGSFTISDLPSGESFYLELVNAEKKFVAPISFGATTEGVVMAITPEAGSGTLNLGQIVYEGGKGTAVPTMEVGTTKLDKNSTAKPKSSEEFVPVGTGLNLGRGTGEAKFSGTLKDKVDEDNDGLPDVIDIDDNGDGKVDGLDPTPRLNGRFEVRLTGLNNTNSFANLPEIYEEYPSYINGAFNTSPIDVASKTILAIEVVMTPGTSPSAFSSVKVVEGPAWLDTAIIRGSDPTTYSGYPADGTSWKSTAYSLYPGNGRWAVWVTPYGTPEAGDVLKFRVIPASGTAQDFISTITYIFVDVPKLVGYSYLESGVVTTKEGNDLNLSTYQTGAGGKTNVFAYKGDTLTLIWAPPKDDTGTPLTNMDHALDGIIYYNQADQSFYNTSMSIQPTPIASYKSFGPAYTYIFTPTPEATLSYFKLDIKDQSPSSGGGNSSQLIRFKKI